MKAQRKYQYNFSQMLHEQMHDFEGREKKAKTMLAILSHYYSTDLNHFSALDVGCSTGIISYYLAKCFGNVIGIVFEETAIDFARSEFNKDGLEFFKIDFQKMLFSDTKLTDCLKKQNAFSNDEIMIMGFAR